jgi:uncharacterized membrane protein YedE/YeeE
MVAIFNIIAQTSQAGSDSAVGVVGGTGAREIIIGFLTGIAFGAILQRVGASSYTMIINMLRLKNLTILKFLFLAIAVGSVGMYVVDTVGTAHIGIAPLYLLGISTGGLIFGVGWALAGYCPGTSLVAMAQGKPDAAITVLGGLLGAFTLSITWDYIKLALVDHLDYGNKSLAEAIGTRPLLVAIFLAAVIIAFVFTLSYMETKSSLTPEERPKAAPH